MKNSGAIWIIGLVLILLDSYVFSVIRFVSQGVGDKTRMFIFSTYWSLSAMAVLVVLLFPYVPWFQTHKFFRNYVFAILIGLFFTKLLASVFFLTDDIRRASVWVLGKFFPGTTSGGSETDSGGISRSTFLSWLGLGIGGSLFATLLYGFTNKYNYQVKKIQLAFANLPASFKGFKILHISDIHSGSFQDKQAVLHGVEIIAAQKADVILFTGDLVNDLAEEMNDYIDVFSRLQAPMGVFSTLGNHDYGDYYQWPDRDEAHILKEKEAGKRLFSPLQQASIEKLKLVHSQLGWRLLMNEHVALEKNGAQIALLGIENWGAKGNFPKYGRMDLAHPGTEHYPFKILMSHDPSHWDAEVRTKYTDIDLMLAGHTHGMQFGVELPFLKWSPVKWMYKQWAGLYEEGQQKLYVNRGYGFIGYPGRVGILPEITVIELV